MPVKLANDCAGTDVKYELRSGGVNVNAPVELSYDSAAVPALAVVTLNPVRASPSVIP